MIDLSNNNPQGPHNFEVAYVKGGQRRVYLKCIEGTGFVDKTYATMKAEAEKVGFKVGGYNFLHPLQATPSEVATLFEQKLGGERPGKELRACIDCEYGSPSVRVGWWIVEVAALLKKHYGYTPLIYGSGFWLEGCSFRVAPGPLWLAAYGRDDGKEYPVGKLPSPWKTLTAHQYTDKATVIGISGKCDLSHVFVGANVEIPKGAKRN